MEEGVMNEKEQTKFCKWIHTKGITEEWENTECGEYFFLISGYMNVSNIKYCPYCGKEIDRVDKEIKTS